MKFFGLFLIYLISLPVTAVEGWVIGISDGDTVTILTKGNVEKKIRLGNIDAPEKGQPWGQRAKQALSSKIYKKLIFVEEQEIDRYGRLVGIIFFEGRNINKELVKDGYAWVYPRYNRDPSLVNIQIMAEKSKLGLWSMPKNKIQAPWEYRRFIRTNPARY